MHCDYCGDEAVSWTNELQCRVCVEVLLCCRECDLNHDSGACLDCEIEEEERQEELKHF